MVEVTATSGAFCAVLRYTQRRKFEQHNKAVWFREGLVAAINNYLWTGVALLAVTMSSRCSSNDTFNFTDEEIRSELSRLGYNDIGADQFEEFKRGMLHALFTSSIAVV